MPSKIFNRFHDAVPQKGKEGGLPAIEFCYRCAQDTKSKAKSRKHADMSKHQDCQNMSYFDCESHLNIMLQVVYGVLTAKIDLKHMDDHIPYRATTVPLVDLEWISANRTRSMKDVST